MHGYLRVVHHMRRTLRFTKIDPDRDYSSYVVKGIPPRYQYEFGVPLTHVEIGELLGEEIADQLRNKRGQYPHAFTVHLTVELCE